MINSELSEISYVIQAGVTTYPIGFEYHFNENNSPQLLVKIGESVAIINVDFQLSADESEIILIPTEEEAQAQNGPNDTGWMDRIVGEELLIARDIPFVQTSDYSVGRISPEQIEYDFDRTVMRDQEILHKLNDFTVDVALAESLANAAVETANEAAAAANQATATANTALETANDAIDTANDAKTVATQASEDAVDAIADSADAVNKAEAADMTATTAMELAAEAVTVAQGAEAAVANKQDKLTAGTNVSIVGTTINVDGYSKTEIDNKVTIIEADIDANAEAIQKTREDYIEADSDIHQILNSHAGELTTLHNDVDAVGDQVSGIEEKIPGTASASNPLVTKQELLDEEMDIREDLNTGLSELQTQVTAQAAEIATKQDKLTAGENITIVDGVISSTGGVSGDYLPLAGGTMTGPIRWGNFTAISGYDGAITISTSASSQYSFSDTSFYSNATDNRQLGVPNYPWTKVFATAISSGTSNITVPAKAGTFALLEDLASYVTIEEFDNTISGIAADFVQREELDGGTTGQVLTKTDDGFEWKDATGGGTIGTGYKDIQINYEDPYVENKHFYKVGIPEALNATLPVGTYSCEIIILTNDYDNTSEPWNSLERPYVAFKIYFKNSMLGVPEDAWTEKYKIVIVPSVENSVAPYFTNAVSNTSFKYSYTNGIVCADWAPFDENTINAGTMAFGRYDGMNWLDWTTNQVSFRARVSKIKNEETGELLDYPDVSLFTEADTTGEEYSSLWSSFIQSPASIDINSIIPLIPLPDYVSMSAGDALFYDDSNKKILQINISLATCRESENVNYDLEEDSLKNSGPWSARISMTTADKASEMTFEYSNGYGFDRIEILHKSGIFESVDKFDFDKHFSGGDLYLSNSNGEAIFDQKIRVRMVSMGAAEVNFHQISIGLMDSISSYVTTQPIQVIELGDISAALTAILGE